MDDDYIAENHILLTEAEARIAELEARNKLLDEALTAALKDRDYFSAELGKAEAKAERWRNPSCSGCNGPHPFDTTIPSEVWNAVIRANDLPEYLCLTCIVREFVNRGVGFSATLWGVDFNGVEIEVATRAAQASERK